MQALQCELLIHASDCVIHGVVYTGTGNQRENGHNQIGDCGIFANTCHDFGIGGSKQGRPEIGAQVIAADFKGNQIHHPCGCAAEGAEQSAGTVDIKQNREAHATEKAEKALRECVVCKSRCVHRFTPKYGNHTPCGGSAQRQCHSSQKNLHDTVDTGSGITVNDIAHGIRKEQTRHKDHQSADDHHIRIAANLCSAHQVCQKGHGESSSDGAEEGICLHILQKTCHKANQNTADTTADAIQPVAAEENRKTGRTQKITQQIYGETVVHTGLANDIEPTFAFNRVGLAVTDGTAETVKTLHRV